MFPLGWCFTVRPREEYHAWDRDARQRERNLRFEDTLDRVLDDYEPPQHRRKDDSDVHPLIRYGVRVGIPSVMASCLVYWLVMKIDTKLDASLDMSRAHHSMTVSMAEQGHRTEQLLERAVAVLTAGCYNAAKTPAERGQCAQAASR